MRIVTFNNLGTGHLVVETKCRGGHKLKTLCGRDYPGVLGEQQIEEPQAPYDRNSRLHDGHLHLCGRCQVSLESFAVKAAYWRSAA